MKKRFKSKKTSQKNYLKIIIILFITIISAYITYTLLYSIHLSKLTNQEIITHIIKTTKNNKYKGTIIDKYLNPYNILKEEFSLKESTIEVNNNIKEEPLVYIYCTHETESYKDSYLEVYNITPTIKNMSYILQDYLIDLDIPTIVESQSITGILRENNWSYKYSYQASKIAIEETINNTKSLRLIIDLHRDSSSLDKTLLEYNNKKYARILFVVGKEHVNYEYNYNLSNTLRTLLEEEIPGITRGISLKEGEGVNGIYNQDLSKYSILIELGGQYNEIEELNNTLEVLSKVILRYKEEYLWKIHDKLG